MIKTSMLLIFKAMIFSPHYSEIFFVQINEIKGFQFGNLKNGDKKIHIHLFPQNNTHYSLLFSGFTQEEINAILSNIVIKKT